MCGENSNICTTINQFYLGIHSQMEKNKREKI